MAGNLIYRGPGNSQPRTISGKTVNAALLPGTFVVEGAATLTQAATHGGLIRLLAHRDFYSHVGSFFDDSHPLATPYKAGETAVAYVMEVGQQYQAAVVAGSYTFGQPLTIGEGGQLKAAVSGEVVIATASEAMTATAGALLDIEIANSYRA